MKKVIIVSILCCHYAMIFASAYTTAIYTNELWSVRYRGPDTPIGFRPVSVASIGIDNPWDDVWFFPSRPNPWGIFYRYLYDARWICWLPDGRDPAHPATIGAPPHRYSYYSPWFKIPVNISRATLWAAVDDEATMRMATPYSCYTLPVNPSSYDDIERFDLTEYFQSISGSTEPYQIIFDVNNTRPHYTGIIAYLSFDYGDIETFVYTIGEGGWKLISMPFYPVEPGATSLVDIFPNALEVQLTYNGCIWQPIRHPCSVSLTGNDGDALRTYSFWVYFSCGSEYSIRGIPIVEQRYIDYPFDNPLRFGSVYTAVPFSRAVSFPTGIIASYSTWESFAAIGSESWRLGISEITPLCGHETYPLHISGYSDLPYSFDFRARRHIRSIVMGSNELALPFDEITPIQGRDIAENREITIPPARFVAGEIGKPEQPNKTIDEKTLTNIDKISIDIHPSPFNSILRIELSYRTEVEEPISIDVFDNRGRKVYPIYYGLAKEGIDCYTWNGNDHYGHPCPNGIYFIRVHSSVTETSKKAVLLR